MDKDLIFGVGEYLSKLSDERFYGVIEIQYQDGQIILVRKQETFKPNMFVLVERRKIPA